MRYLELNELDDWIRIGSHRLDFYATPEEVQQWLPGGLPKEYEPYQVIGAKRTGNETSKVFLVDPQQFLNTLRVTDNVGADWFVWSQRLMPDFVHSGEEFNQRLFLFNGLLMLRILVSTLRRDMTSIMVVNRLKHKRTNEMRETQQSVLIFQRLRNSVYKKLVYTTLGTSSDGTEYELNERMSGGAYRDYQAGTPYPVKPGRRL